MCIQLLSARNGMHSGTVMMLSSFDTEQLDLGDVGEIFKIRLSLDRRGKNPVWNLKKVCVSV